VSRNGARIEEKVGDIRLKDGDTLLLEAGAGFVEQYKNSRDFYLVSGIVNSGQPNYNKSTAAWAILATMIISVSFGFMSMFQASWLAAGAMLIVGCCSTKDAMEGVDWTVLLVIAATLGIGNALSLSGAADVIGSKILLFAQTSPYLALGATY